MLSWTVCRSFLDVTFIDQFVMWFFFFKQKTAYEMRISDWSSDVCSSDLVRAQGMGLGFASLIKAARALSSRDQGDMSAAAWMQRRRDNDGLRQIGRAHVCTPVTNAHLVCRLLLETKHIGDQETEYEGREITLGPAQHI